MRDPSEPTDALREAFDAGAAAMRAAALQHVMDVDGERWVFTDDLEGIEVDDLENRP